MLSAMHAHVSPRQGESRRSRLTFLVALVCLFALPECVPMPALPAGADVACSSGEDCPAASVCVLAWGRCEPTSSACVEPDESAADGFRAAADGKACRAGGAGGVCSLGHCRVPICGDGFLDEDQGEECDDGAGNGAGAGAACRSTCRRPTCGDGVVDRGEACDGTATGGTCTRDCLLACDPGHIDVDADPANGCEDEAVVIERALLATQVVEDAGDVYWTDTGAIRVLRAGETSPDLLHDGVSFHLSVNEGCAAWSEVHRAWVAPPGTSAAIRVFSPPAPCSLDVPYEFGECQSLLPIGIGCHGEVAVAIDGSLYRQHLQTPKSVRVILELSGEDGATLLAVRGEVAWVATELGRVIEVPFAFPLEPARVLVEGAPLITALAADEASLVWGTVTGSVVRHDRETREQGVVVEGQPPVIAVAVRDEDLYFITDEGGLDPGRLLHVRSDGTGLGIYAAGSGQLSAVAIGAEHVFFTDAERGYAIGDGEGGALFRGQRRAPPLGAP